jgi:methyltransferase
MLGHKSSLAPIIAFLKEAGASSWSETEFCQGRTTRWGLAWTFFDNFKVPKLPLIRPKNNGKGPPPLNYIISAERWSNKGDLTVACILMKIIELFNSLKVIYKSMLRPKLDFIYLRYFINPFCFAN